MSVSFRIENAAFAACSLYTYASAVAKQLAWQPTALPSSLGGHSSFPRFLPEKVNKTACHPLQPHTSVAQATLQPCASNILQPYGQAGSCLATALPSVYSASNKLLCHPFSHSLPCCDPLTCATHHARPWAQQPPQLLCPLNPTAATSTCKGLPTLLDTLERAPSCVQASTLAASGAHPGLVRLRYMDVGALVVRFGNALSELMQHRSPCSRRPPPVCCNLPLRGSQSLGV